MSKFIIGKDRNQTEFFCLDQTIEQENEVRFIELFVSSINLGDFGFKTAYIENGRPAYHPSDLLKLFIYGYLNRIRSSRHLEKECKRNLEVMWLMRGLVPDHNTIANFRKDNPKAIQKVFRATVQLAKHFDLIGGKLVAGDSTKLRAQNSKKNNFNPKKIDRHIAYIDAKLEEYASILAGADGDSKDDDEQKETKQKIDKHLKQRKKYEAYKKELNETGDTQISTSDPDSRQMITRNNITEVAYNVQSTVDARHNIPIDFKVTNQNDSKAMGGMLRRAKVVLQHTKFTALYDKGYHTGSEFRSAKEQGIEVLVAIPDIGSHAPDPSFDVEHFIFNNESNYYTCPAGQTLTTNGTWYNKANGNANKSFNRIRHYKTKACLTCTSFERCTRNKTGRFLERSEHADVIYENKQRMAENLPLYRRRQAIVEHPFGVIKRQWDFYYIMTKKSMKHAEADVGLIFTAYNQRRILNLIDQNQLKESLKGLALTIWGSLRHFKLIKPTFLRADYFPRYLRTQINVAYIAYI